MFFTLLTGRGAPRSWVSRRFRQCAARRMREVRVLQCGGGCTSWRIWRVAPGSVERGSQTRKAHDYEVKPHGLLVSVSLTHYCASTPDLSTWWSATALQGSQAPGRSHLQARFPLRCFQRLSFPYIATQRCLWRDNWYTSGTSTPVLSY